MAGAAALFVPAVALSATGQSQAAVQLLQQQELLSDAVVTDVSESDQVVRVDVAQDPGAADAWFEESEDVLDGWTVVVAGMETASGKERAALDAEAVADDPTSAAESCPDIPETQRSADGSTTPYLGCGPSAGVQPTARTVTKGSARTTLAKAVDEVLDSYLPGADLPPTKVRVTHGDATVDVAPELEPALADAGVYPGDVWEALLFTAHSNGTVDSVKFTLGGDCLAFAYATGGDICAATDLPIDLG